MDDAAAQDKRNQLDAELAKSPDDVGIAFGTELFNAFVKRGWLTMEDFSAYNTRLFPQRVTAYDRVHFVFPSLDIGETAFEISQLRKVHGD